MSLRQICGAAGAALVLGVGLPQAQTPPANPQAASPSAAAPAAQVRPDEVVATIDGEKYTAGRIQQLRGRVPPPFSQAVSRMNNKTFLKSYADLLTLARKAEKEKLDEQDPYKDQLAFLRMNFLAQSYLNSLSRKISVSQKELEQYYNEHKADYEEAGIKAIYVAFSPSAGKQPSVDPQAKKPLTEEQAKAKAESLIEELKKGADFEKVARENSDDASSAQKGGHIGSIKKNAPDIPADLKEAIFRLKPGEFTAPVRQPAGFYIFKLDSTRVVPYTEVASSIASLVQGQKMRAELDQILAAVKVTYDNEGFFSETPAATPAAKP
ncbi:MAG: peptidylprolyl isomerase [Acidobacteria bacterium]|nr:peptidylprolyl isomerase [Acidobacteriota bacterium]